MHPRELNEYWNEQIPKPREQVLWKATIIQALAAVVVLVLPTKQALLPIDVYSGSDALALALFSCMTE